MAGNKNKTANGKVPFFNNIETSTDEYLTEAKENRGINKGVMVDMAVTFYRKFHAIPEDKLSKLIAVK